MNEVAKMDGGAMVVADPFSPTTYHTTADGVIASAFAKRDEIAAAFAALGNLDEAPLGAVKACRKAAEEADAQAKDYKAELLEALLGLSGFKAVVTQLQGNAARRIDPLSVRGRFAEIIKACKAREDAERIVEPPRAWVVHMDMNGDQFKAVSRAAEKAGCPFVHYAVPQGDWATRDIQRWFKANA